jgi:hypothetical protein
VADPPHGARADPLWIRPAQIAPGAESKNANIMSVLLLCFALFSAGPTWFTFDQRAFLDGPTVTARVHDRSVTKSSGKNSSTSYRLGYTYSVDGVTYEGRSSVSKTLYDSTLLYRDLEIHVHPDDPSRSEADPDYGLSISILSMGCFGSGFALSLYLCAAAWAAGRHRRRPDAPS